MTVEKLQVQRHREYPFVVSMPFGVKYVLGEADVGTLFLAMLWIYWKSFQDCDVLLFIYALLLLLNISFILIEVYLTSFS